MANITSGGLPISTNGELPVVGSKAPDFILVDKDLNDVQLDAFKSKKKILSIVPSLDTPLCSTSTQKFNELLKEREDVQILTVSADLPFAIKRFCIEKDISNIKPLSMMRSKKFAEDYGVLINSGRLSGLTARAIVIIDENDDVIYTELVSDIAREPDYDSVLNIVNN